MKITCHRVLALVLTLYFATRIVSVAGDGALPHDSDYDYDPPVPGSYTLPIIKVAPDGAIIDSAGQASNLRELTHGRITVLSFIYTQRLAEYSEAMREQKSGCEWRFATTKSRAALDSILNGYGQTVDKRSNPNDPQGPLYHILRIFLIDREGRIRNIYSSATLDPRLVLADVKTLLLEETKLSKQ